MNSTIATVRARGIAVAVLLCMAAFLLVYMPAFLLVGGLRLEMRVAVPVVIAATAANALILIILSAKRAKRPLSAFGFRSPSIKYLAVAILVGAPLSALAAWILAQHAEPGPLAGLAIAPALVFAYFALAAPVQEELIFRGLLQTNLAGRLSASGVSAVLSEHVAASFAAVLFAVIHLSVGPITAACALALGLLAGELRRRSGSLLPAIVCHILFNLPGVLQAS